MTVVIDRLTGEIRKAQIFVAVAEASAFRHADEEGDCGALANARHADQEIEPIGEIGMGEASEMPFRRGGAQDG
ncbi:MAG: hypothetical protein WBD65_04120, partial [Methylocella sp.]